MIKKLFDKDADLNSSIEKFAYFVSFNFIVKNMINRIVLIGNGFDLAHGMKTSYQQFMKAYWKNSFTDYYNCAETIYECDEFEIATSLKSKFTSDVDYFTYIIQNSSQLKINNQFFIELSKQHHLTDWVDIEGFFYERLLKSASSGEQNNVTTLNKNFEQVKLLLEKHLNKEMIGRSDVHKNISNAIKNSLYEYVRLQDLSEEGLMKVTDQIWSRIKLYIGFDRNPDLNPDYLHKYEREFIKNIGYADFDKNYLFNFLKNQVLPEIVPITFLNFNYTDTEQIYCENMDDVIHIHGEINNERNPMIFGYGDELDENFSTIEKLNKNDYLENVKSINYSRTGNYKALLKTLNSGMYQIFVVGHSCGNTDRTLLNTIFEHDNCVSIKILYHQSSEKSDNYIEVYKNISRNFSNKAMLRDRVVNKSYSNPLISYALQKENH